MRFLLILTNIVFFLSILAVQYYIGSAYKYPEDEAIYIQFACEECPQSATAFQYVGPGTYISSRYNGGDAVNPYTIYDLESTEESAISLISINLSGFENIISTSSDNSKNWLCKELSTQITDTFFYVCEDILFPQ